LLIDKAAILQALEELREYELVDEAHALLPDRLDTEEHRHLFLRFGIDPRDLHGRMRARPVEPEQS
jgi:hypothetical protein